MSGEFVNFQASVERGLDKLGYIPIIQEFSGALRITIGTVQAVVASVLGILTSVLKEFAWNRGAYESMSRFQEGCFEQAFHGVANIFGGVIEAGVPVAGGFALYLLSDSRMSYAGEIDYSRLHRYAYAR